MGTDNSAVRARGSRGWDLGGGSKDKGRKWGTSIIMPTTKIKYNF